MSWTKRTIRRLVNRVGYDIARLDEDTFEYTSLPTPPKDAIEAASKYFRATFPISPDCELSTEEIESKIATYFWHYPFKFGERFVESDRESFTGIHGRYYGYYSHVFPALLSMTGGSLSGNRVLDVACNAGWWSIQAKLAGADSVTGVDGSAENVDQANFILALTGLDGIEYQVRNVYDVSREALGQFDITFCFSLLYHLDKPILALERMREVTKRFLVLDTVLLKRESKPVLMMEEDPVHRQNVSNLHALVPSKRAVVQMLRHVGFREVLCVPNSVNSPENYMAGSRGTFLAVI